MPELRMKLISLDAVHEPQWIWKHPGEGTESDNPSGARRSEKPNREPSGRNDALMVSKLIAEQLITVAEVGPLKDGDFERLVAGSSAGTLDDGEAATIAYASECGMIGLIDEKKANNICRTQYPALLVGTTVDLLAADAVQAALSRADLANATLNALMGARMRVLPGHLDWVVNLIGQDNAAKCESLPKRVRSIPAKA
jgi:predicted nucleic acid-binding protein